MDRARNSDAGWAEYKELFDQMTPEQRTVQMLLILAVLRSDDGALLRGDDEHIEGLKAYGLKLSRCLENQGQDLPDISINEMHDLASDLPEEERQHWLAALVGCYERRDRELWDDLQILV